MGVTVDQLQVFRAVVQAGSLTAAGERLGLAQSSVSRTIRDLERRVGTPVLHRGGRGVRPTATGQELLRMADQLIGSWDTEWRRFREFLEGNGGTVSIACLPSLVTGYLAPVIGRFRRRHPQVTITIQDGYSDTILRSVRHGSADFGITSHPPVSPPLRATPLVSDLMHVVVPIDHRFAHLDEVPWSALADEDVIATGRGSSTRPLVEFGFRSNGLELAPALEASQLVTVGGLVAAGLGVSPQPELTLSTLPLASIAAVPLVDPVVHRHVSVVQRVDRPMQPAARLLLDELRAVTPSTATGSGNSAAG